VPLANARLDHCAVLALAPLVGFAPSLRVVFGDAALIFAAALLLQLAVLLPVCGGSEAGHLRKLLCGGGGLLRGDVDLMLRRPGVNRAALAGPRPEAATPSGSTRRAA